MSVPLELVLTLHLHLPAGTGRRDSDRAWTNCFQPLIGALHHTPDVHVALVLAGDLMSDFAERHPEGVEWIRALLERGQIELLATPMHEPVLSAIPERDASRQIEIHAAELRRVFGVRPTGCWVPHGVWDPTLPRVLAPVGIRFALVPDRHLEAMGQPEGGVYGVWRTEREGHCLALLPLDTAIREAAADVPVKDVLAHLRKRKDAGHLMVAVGLHGSRFGLHPGSSAKQDQSWFATLLAAIGRARGAVNTVLPAQAVALGVERGRVYLPTLGPQGEPVPWERTLIRYDAANRLHKKMLRVSQLADKVDRHLHDEDQRLVAAPDTLIQMQRYLYRAQGSAPYWHARHAGVYDPALRALAWRDLLRAERLGLEAVRAEERLIVEHVDLDCDGHDELVLRTPDTTAVVDPARGGVLTELSIASAAINLADVVSRIVEPYHRELDGTAPPVRTRATARSAEDEDTMGGSTRDSLDAALRVQLRRLLGQDAVPRALFAERFPAPGDPLEALRSGRYTERGGAFRTGMWEVVSAERHGTDAVRAVLRRDGSVHDGVEERRVRLEKRYVVRQRGIAVRHELTNRDPARPLRLRMGVELNLSLGPGSERQLVKIDGRPMPVDTVADAGEVDLVRLEGEGLLVDLHLLQAARLWHYPVQTVHRHLGTWDTAVQGVCLLFLTDLDLQPGQSSRLDLKLKVEIPER